ncbi:hypothetical protein FALBO_11508 [Fusarium albosuccineum]|uniref:Uncharacterized protein n=1 Tax=Fusarium albosuccineum TaxID=1237068 RepID=A0A8H4L3N3_9HYPO|nr:hypothetical protein FALBO_11508 [Fusarium albosuccineum]
MSRIGFLQRLQRVGLLSLLALLVGGLVLILVGINAFIDLRKDGQLGYTPPGNKLPFRHGSNWSIQTWIAVIGAAFGLLSFGFSETYIHVFDSWSSRQSKQASGLDYGRYLNTQPRAPVSYGIRGFPYFATLRYFLIAMGIFASIAYKFVIVKPDVFMYENIDPQEVEISAPGLTATAGGQVQAWIGDVPLPTPDALNRAYLHEFQAGDQEGGTNPDAGEPPLSIVMANQASCFLASTSRPLFYPQDSGYLLTRQIVMVANMTQEDGDFFITQRHRRLAEA